MKYITIIVTALMLSACQPAVWIKQTVCDPGGTCTTTEVKSNKDHPNGVSLTYTPETGQVDYHSGGSVANHEQARILGGVIQSLITLGVSRGTPFIAPVNPQPDP